MWILSRCLYDCLWTTRYGHIGDDRAIIHKYELLRLTLLDLLLYHVELKDVFVDLCINRLLQTLKHSAPWFNDSPDADVYFPTLDLLLFIIFSELGW